MADKTLDFNQPLLSVRRFSSKQYSASPHGKEKIYECSSSNSPISFYKSDLKSGPTTHPGTVPFTWEQSPGKPKNEQNQSLVAIKQAPIAPPGWIAKNNPMLSPRNTSYSTGSGTSDTETFVDANESLSKNDSMFLNYDVGRLGNLDVKPKEETDTQTRDVMMGRFLTAAKAMASETPLHQLLKRPQHHHRHGHRRYILPGYSGQDRSEAGEEEGADDEEDEPIKACGLFSRFCLKNPKFIINSVPGMKAKRTASPAISSSVCKKNGTLRFIENRGISNIKKRQMTFLELLAIDSENSGSRSSTLGGKAPFCMETVIRAGSPNLYLIDSSLGESEFSMFKSASSNMDVHEERSNGRFSQYPVNPPLPKSPSESWLRRTMESIYLMK